MLDEFDRVALLALIKDLHAASRDNQAFLAARLGLGFDPLEPYKKTIARWIAPDFTKGQDISVAKAKKAIADYRKAIGRPEGLGELLVFFCEEAIGQLLACGVDDEGYHVSLVRMFERAIVSVGDLPEIHRQSRLQRLDVLRRKAKSVGWGVKEAFDESWHDAAP